MLKTPVRSNGKMVMALENCMMNTDLVESFLGCVQKFPGEGGW